jgi:putative redox protein
MKARVKWVENVCFIGESESNHSVILDGPEELGGNVTDWHGRVHII